MINTMSSSPQFKFHEQWLGISTLCSLAESQLQPEIKKIEDFINNTCHSITSASINSNFVPEEKDREKIAEIAQNLIFTVSWENYIEDFQYEKEKRTYNKLGNIIIRVGVKSETSPNFNVSSIRPQYLQQIVFGLWYPLCKQFHGDFIFDEKTVPYAVNVSIDYANDTTVKWNQETIDQHKREIGDWCALYSGQFPDYHDLLYAQRVAHNLSNRTSEMHFVLRNSGFIFMERANYEHYFIKDETTPKSTGYMYNTVIKTILQMRTIGFAMILVNNEIDTDTSQLSSPEFKEKDPALIKDDLEKTNRLKMILQRTLAPFFTDLSRSHRQHYHRLLTHCVDLYEIEKNWEMISDKLESNTQELNSIFLDKQEEANKRQEKILNIVNLILGASIIFEIIDFLITKDDELQSLVKMIVGACFLVLIIAFVGRLYLSKLFKRKKKKKIQK